MSDHIGADVANVLALVHEVDNTPLRRAVMWVDEPPEDGMTGYRRLSASVLAQCAVDATHAAQADHAGTLRELAWLSAQPETFAVWCEVLGLDVEEWIDGLLRRLATPGRLRRLHRSASAAAD